MLASVASAGGPPAPPSLARLPACAPRSVPGLQQRLAAEQRAHWVSARRRMSALGWRPASVPPPKSALKSLLELAQESLPELAHGSVPKRASAWPPTLAPVSPPWLPPRSLLSLGSLPLAISRLRSHPSSVVQPVSRRRARAAGFPPPAVGFSVGLRTFWP